jgi:hypothetical protein
MAAVIMAGLNSSERSLKRHRSTDIPRIHAVIIAAICDTAIVGFPG